ncbi:MAG: LLM class flavin-dependent oxidoreductase [Gammaproteobacteria bacterium]|nr:LLM class flavin-dependent oxidoreductase [Gammaproteobacteria bacterium]
MKIGISIASSYPGAAARTGAQNMVERAAAADKAGLDSLFVGDHHNTPTPYYQNSPIMGRLLAEWGAKPAGALYLLPLWNPVLAAEQIATLAGIARGRFIMQCGLGRDGYQFNAMGRNIKFRPSAFEQSLDVMRALWSGEQVSLHGRWQFTDARISPLPPEPIEVWIGASARVSIDRAARLGDAWLADPAMNLEQAKSAIDYYLECLPTHNKSAEVIAIRRDIYVAESTQDADATSKLIAGYRGFNAEALIIGEVESVAEQMQRYAELGYTDIIIRNLHPDQAKAIASIQRLASVKRLIQGTSQPTGI